MRKESVIWKHFEKQEDYTALCKHCSQTCSYRSTTGNLNSHLRRLHPAVFWAEKNGSGKDPLVENASQERKSGSSVKVESDDNSRESSGLWMYYERVGSHARCMLCGIASTADDEGMLSHLKERHARQVLEVSGSDNEAKSDNNGDLYTEVVYLEDEAKMKKKPKTILPFTSKKERQKMKRRLRSLSTSSDEVLVARKRHSNVTKTSNDRKTETTTKSSDQLENFSSYILTLLKSVPEDVSTRLQMDIINLIMQEKLKLKQKKEVEEIEAKETEQNHVPNTSYLMTVTKDNIGNNSNININVINANNSEQLEGEVLETITVPVTE